jgi:hypothetical protein
VLPACTAKPLKKTPKAPRKELSVVELLKPDQKKNKKCRGESSMILPVGKRGVSKCQS